MKKKLGDLLSYSKAPFYKAKLQEYTDFLLHKNWPKINKKLGLDKDAFLVPEIKLTMGDSEYDNSTPESFYINYLTALEAYKKEVRVTQGLDIKSKDLLEDEIIHECVHYIQDKFYDIGKSHYDCATEGLAEIVAIELDIKNKNYTVATAAIVDYFIETKEKYKDYFELPLKYTEHIKNFIKKGKKETYRPKKRAKNYSKGFVFICKNYGVGGNYLDILLNPFKNKEVV